MSVIYKKGENIVIDNEEFGNLSEFKRIWSEDGLKMGIISKTNEIRPVEKQVISDFKKENGEAYVNFDELNLIIDSFFVNASLGGAIKESHIFEDDAERDVYFSASLGELNSGLEILVNGKLQVWTNGDAPDVYDNTNWHDYSTPLTASEIKILYESNPQTNALKDEKYNILEELHKDTEGNTVAETSWIFPPNTIYIGRNAALSNALRALNLYDPILNKRGLLLAQLYNESGSSDAFIYDIDPTSVVIANDGLGLIQNSSQFKRTPANDEIIESFNILTDFINTLIDVKIVIRLNSHIGIEVYNVIANITTDSNGYANVQLSNPIITDAGLELFMEFTIDGMIGSLVNGEFIPNHKANIQLLRRKIIATRDWVDEKVTNPTWVAAHSSNSDITYGGFRTTGKIRQRVLSTGVDTFFQSNAPLPITDEASWIDWQNRENLTYNII